MADKAISELISASEVTSTDLFVLEQAGTAKKLSGQTLITFLLKLVEAHGGIVSINKTSTSGLVDTYTITMTDLSTTSFTVTNGAKGDKGDNSYVWVKYSSAMPTKDSDIYDTPDNYMGIYSGNASTAPTSYAAYNWFQIKGAKGDTGPAASIVSQSVRYQVSTNGTVPPSGAWLDAIPIVTPGQYLWTQSMLQFNTGAAQISYSVSRFGIDGSGSVVAVNGKSPDEGGNVVLTAEDVNARPNTWTPTAAEVGAIPDTYVAPVTKVNSKTGEVILTADDVGAIPATDGSVTRAKLAADALYSPIVEGVGARYITSADIGKTLKGAWNAAMTLTITQANSANIPAGAEFAVLRWGNSSGEDCKIIADGTRLLFTGDDTLHKNGTAKISEALGMIALKKTSSDPTQGDSWLVTGNVEVVS